MPSGSHSITEAQTVNAWTVIRQWGLVPRSTMQPLQFPTRAYRAADGTTLISEELSIHKQVPFRFECRTIRVNRQGEVLFDSTKLGISDGFGCLCGDNRIALLRRTHWELLLLTPTGEVELRLPLERVSKRIPRYACWTYRATLLVIFFNRSFEIDIAEIDCSGRLLWFLPASATKIGIPASAQLLASDHLLIADSFRHIILEINRDGQLCWQHGQEGSPGDTEGRLSSPNSVEATRKGARLIVDTRNHLVLTQSMAGGLPIAHPCESGLCDPTYATSLANGNCLICDTGHARVVEVDAQGRLVWQYGGRPVLDRPFSYPRSIDVLAPHDYLVADTGKNRVLRLQGDEITVVPTSGGLFWPRCCRRVGEDGLLIADARNGRIVELSAAGSQLRQVSRLFSTNGHTSLPEALEDPHDVRQLPNGHLLVTDSAQDLVLEIDWTGQIHFAVGCHDQLKLKDPHSAQGLPDGSLLISDTGHQRVILVGRDGTLRREFRAIEGEGCCYRLHHPRYAERSDDGTLVISDTGNNRVLGATMEGRLCWEFSTVPNSEESGLNQPRWATLFSSTELLVCDHFHHRMLHVSRRHLPQAMRDD